MKTQSVKRKDDFSIVLWVVTSGNFQFICKNLLYGSKVFLYICYHISLNH